MIQYRPDVDGLRAVAVLSVVVYHAGVSWLPGGFIGVDIFFVISGYLITGIVAGEIGEDRFSLGRFYVRRARRILPALFVVIATTWTLGVWLLAPSELANLGHSIAATTAFVSNITFWREVGYFDIAAERKPLLHTWSLAVEEQFYLAWPLLLALLSRTSVNRLLVVVALAAISFALSIYAVAHWPAAAFFLIPTRAWELAVGAALALGLLRPPRRQAVRNALAASGLALIVVGLLLLDRVSPFPGLNALYPCLGTAMLIHAGEKGNHLLSRYVLATKPIVLVGLVSYSLYLWHWPLLALARITQRGELSTAESVVLILVAVVLSFFTWRYVEVPFRARTPRKAPAPILVRYAAASIAACALGMATALSDGFVRFAPAPIAATEAARWDNNSLSGRCLRWQSQTGALPGAECVTNADRFARRLVLWGDSHADALAPGVADFAHRHERASHQMTMASCPPLLGARVVGPVGDFTPCAAFNDRVMQYIATSPDIDTVVLSARWTVYAEGSRFGIDDSGPLTYLVDGSDQAWSPESSRRVFARALARTVDAIRAAGKNVLIIGQVPELGISIPTCLARNQLPLAGVRACAIAADLVWPRIDYVSRAIDAVTAQRQRVCVFHPQRALCSATECAGTADEKILYRDDDHLSATGAVALARRFQFDACLVSP